MKIIPTENGSGVGEDGASLNSRHRSSVKSVVIFSDTSWALGGAELMALLSAEVMAERGLKVTFVVGDTAEACPLDRRKIDVVPMSSAPLLQRPRHEAVFSGIYNRKTIPFVRKLIAKLDTPDTVYHVHNWSQIFSPSLFEALKPVASRLFLSAHDFALSCPNLSFSNFKQDGKACELKPLSMSCIGTNCDRRAYSHKLWRVVRSVRLRQTLHDSADFPLVGIIHPSMSEWYQRGGVPGDKIRVVRNPVNPYSATRIEAEKNKDLFFVGRLVEEKGPDLAAEAARMCGMPLRIIGDGDMRPDLEARFPEVRFEGRRPHDQISELVKSARAVIVPSRLPETFTLVANEALRAGIPVVSFTDVDGAEMAELGGAIVVPPRQASSLAEALERLKDDNVVEAMSKTAFQEAYRFSNTRESWTDVLLDCYAELLSKDAKAA